MAKVMNPFFSTSAHGRFAGVVYQTGASGQIVRGHVPQRGKPTLKQLNQNFLFGVVADSWRLLSQVEKDVYNDRARGTKLTGFNLYVKENIGSPTVSTYGNAKYGTGKYI